MNVLGMKSPHDSKRRFFVLMAAAIIVTVFIGFAPTFYMRSSFPQTRSMSVLLHVHGIVFSAWVVLFLIQTLLIVRSSKNSHKRLGWLSIGVAGTMVVLVCAAMREELRRVNGFPPPPLALALSVFDIALFASLVGAAVVLRRRPEWHKRLMLSATFVLLGAPMFRLTLHVLSISDPARAGVVSALLVDMFFLPCFAYDLITRRRLHPAFVISVGLLILDQVTQAKVVEWQPWINFSTAVQRLLA